MIMGSFQYVELGTHQSVAYKTRKLHTVNRATHTEDCLLWQPTNCTPPLGYSREKLIVIMGSFQYVELGTHQSVAYKTRKLHTVNRVTHTEGCPLWQSTNCTPPLGFSREKLIVTFTVGGSEGVDGHR